MSQAKPRAAGPLGSLLGGLDVDQLRALIDSLNLLAEQEEDRVMWEQVGPTPPLGSPSERVSPPKSPPKEPLREPRSKTPSPKPQYKAMSVSPEPGQKPSVSAAAAADTHHGCDQNHPGTNAEQSPAGVGQGTWSQGPGKGFYNPNGGCGSGGGSGSGGSGGSGGGGGPSHPVPSGVGPEGGECNGVRWYCVTRGRAVGVFAGWNNVSPLVTGVPSAIFARYPSFSAALDAFLDASAGGHIFIVL